MIFTGTDFSQLQGIANGSVRIASASAIPAIISTLSDEKEAIAGGVLGKSTLKIRVLESDISTTAQNLIGAKVEISGQLFRILATKKHPLSAVREITVCEL